MLSRVHLILALLCCALALFVLQAQKKNILPVSNAVPRQIRTITREELSKHNGYDESVPIYLSIKGKVFDVSHGRKYYGKNGSYNVLAGKDASRAFGTGDFTDAGLIADTSGLNQEQLDAVDSWLKFYEQHQDYHYIGDLEQ